MSSGTTTNPWDIINEIKKDVGRIAMKLARGVISVAFDDLYQAHKDIMKSYYEGYTPVDHYYYDYIDPRTGIHYAGIAHGYRRTYNLGENSRVIKGIYPRGKHGFRAVIGIGAENMEDYVGMTGRTFPASAVFDMIWNQGIRGLPPGHRGHIGDVEIDADPVGVHVEGFPHKAMEDFVQTWGDTRGKQVVEDFVKNTEF